MQFASANPACSTELRHLHQWSSSCKLYAGAGLATSRRWRSLYVAILFMLKLNKPSLTPALLGCKVGSCVHSWVRWSTRLSLVVTAAIEAEADSSVQALRDVAVSGRRALVEFQTNMSQRTVRLRQLQQQVNAASNTIAKKATAERFAW